MANEEHRKILIEEGVKAWNHWRKNNPEVQPDLDGVNLQGYNLSGVNLTGALLRNANFQECNLYQASLKVIVECSEGVNEKYFVTSLLKRKVITDASHANFRNSNLARANLKGTVLCHADLRGANLEGAWINSYIYWTGSEEDEHHETFAISADFDSANLSGLNFTTVNFRSYSKSSWFYRDVSCHGFDFPRFRNASLIETKWNGMELSRVDFGGAKLCMSNLSGASLSLANLCEANLCEANLDQADLREANLNKTNFCRVSLISAKLEKSLLFEANLHEADLANINLANVNLDNINLSGANLSSVDFRYKILDSTLLFCSILKKANLSDLYLNGKDFHGVDLTEANLCRVQALGTNFSNATLTGACIEDWHINNKTNFNNVICEYIYLKNQKRERRPSDPNRNFKQGEFVNLVQQFIETVDLIFSDGIDWQSFLKSFHNLQIEDGNDELTIQAIERKTDGAFLIRVEVPTDADKASIEESFWHTYRPILQAKDEQLALSAQVLEDKRNENTKLLNIIETMAIKEDKFLNKVQLKILQSIAQGISYDKEISELLKLPIHEVRYFLEILEKNDFFDEVIKDTDILANESFMLCTLSNKGRVAVDSPDKLIKEHTMSKEVNYNLPNAKFGGGFAAEGGTQIGGRFNDYSITIRQNIDDIESLIASLRENIKHFPDEQREDAEMELEDLEEEVKNPEKRNPKRFRKIIKGLAATGTAVGVFTGSAVKVSDNLNAFTDNVSELGKKLEVQMESNKEIFED